MVRFFPPLLMLMLISQRCCGVMGMIIKGQQRQRCDSRYRLNVLSTAAAASTTSLSSQPTKPTTTTPFCHLQVPEGLCVGLQLLPSSSGALSAVEANNKNNHWLYTRLHKDEIQYGLDHCPSCTTRFSFWMGRLALRSALSELCSPSSPVLDSAILKDPHGRPLLPLAGVSGSISHKECAAVALVRRTHDKDANVFVGVDLESYHTPRTTIARKVLTVHEQSSLGEIEGISSAEEVLLRFSLKEAVYKAIHPIVLQFIGFQQAEIRPLGNGESIVTLLDHDHNRTIAEVSATWRKLPGTQYFLSTAIARAADPPNREQETGVEDS